jgi:murein DD-endopeptidase MepM/ murein hydrolase activator NlpD
MLNLLQHHMSRAAVLLLISLLLAVFLPSVAAETAGPSKTAHRLWTVRWRPVSLVNGAPVLFQVKMPAKFNSLRATWLDHELSFEFNPPSKTWFALAGVSLTTRPGVYPLLFAAETEKGTRVSFRQEVRISRAKYRSIALSVPKQFTEPDAAQLAAIQQDSALKKDVFSRSAAAKEWSGRFVPPVDAPVSDRFGTQRKFNGEVQSVHEGLDYHVPQGTPVSAVNEGTVVLARPLFFEGNCVMLDHGQGLLTLYMHLSEIKVKEGDRVPRGETLGLSGATGRTTGAHLHVAVRWQGVYLDPATLFSLRVPGA